MHLEISTTKQLSQNGISISKPGDQIEEPETRPVVINYFAFTAYENIQKHYRIRKRPAKKMFHLRALAPLHMYQLRDTRRAAT